jgi:UDP-N-acetylmuramate--alanine ligase
VYSSAIAKTNPEFIAAQQAKIPLMSRGQMLAEVMTHYCAVAIAGAHGKTTTSALLAHTFLSAGLDPSFMVGGVLNDIQTPARVGNGNYFVAEADESDASFLFMHPDYMIVTNIDADHLDTYGGSFEELKKSYLQFIHQLPTHGVAVLCIDDPVSRELIPKIQRQVITYGFSKDADVQISDYRQQSTRSYFQIERKKLGDKLSIVLNLPGQHNALNATAIAIISHLVKIADPALLKALAEFSGVGRRFHLHGEMRVHGGDALLLEDYGHHPSEIKATLSAVRSAWPDRRIVLVFQPHRYTRTRDLMNEFAAVLTEPDLLVLLEVYSAGETPIAGADGQSLLRAIEKFKSDKPVFVPVIQDLPARLQNILQANDVVIFQGAGNVGAMASSLANINGKN